MTIEKQSIYERSFGNFGKDKRPTSKTTKALQHGAEDCP